MPARILIPIARAAACGVGAIDESALGRERANALRLAAEHAGEKDARAHSLLTPALQAPKQAVS